MINQSVREAYGEALTQLGAGNARVVVLEADVGSSSQSKLFQSAYPARYFNMGIAEIGMLCTAAGFAASGKIPFVNTFATFMATRASDPVQSLIAYNSLNVKMAGAYCGLSDAYDGASHHSLADVAFMAALPNMTVVCPMDAVQTRKAVFAAAALDGPVFLRLSRAAVPVVWREEDAFSIGKGRVLRDGTDVTIVSSGVEVHQALTAAEILKTRHISAQVLDMHTVKPLDTPLLTRCAAKTGRVVVAEEHSAWGGLGAAAACALAQTRPVPMGFVGLTSFAESGEYGALLHKYRIDSVAIAQKCTQLVQGTPR